jgi:hypothetical protein
VNAFGLELRQSAGKLQHLPLKLGRQPIQLLLPIRMSRWRPDDWKRSGSSGSTMDRWTSNRAPAWKSAAALKATRTEAAGARSRSWSKNAWTRSRGQGPGVSGGRVHGFGRQPFPSAPLRERGYRWLSGVEASAGRRWPTRWTSPQRPANRARQQPRTGRGPCGNSAPGRTLRIQRAFPLC